MGALYKEGWPKDNLGPYYPQDTWEWAWTPLLPLKTVSRSES